MSNKRANTGRGARRSKRARVDDRPKSVDGSAINESRRDILLADHIKLIPNDIVRTHSERKGFTGARGILEKRGGNIGYDRNWLLPTEGRAYDHNNKLRYKNPLNVFFKACAHPTNLNIIKREVSITAQKTSPSLQAAMELIFFYMPMDKDPTDRKRSHPFANCTTATQCLLDLVKTQIHTFSRSRPNSEAKSQRLVDDMRPMLGSLQLILRNLVTTLRVVNQRLSSVRKIIEERFGGLVKTVLKRNAGLFELKGGEKKALSRQSQEARSRRVLRQTPILFEAALTVGLEVVKKARQDNASLQDLLAATMMVTGTRQTEAIILSEYKSTPNKQELAIVSNGLISPIAPTITIQPVAKERAVGTTAAQIFINSDRGVNEVFDETEEVKSAGIIRKSSGRVLLFGSTPEDVRDWVKRLRTKLAAKPAQNGISYSNLDKNNGRDRQQSLKFVDFARSRSESPFNTYIADLLRPLNDKAKFTARSLRPLYVALSYRIWAKQPTSEILWINTVLSHTQLNTSISYNIYQLSSTLNINDKASIESILATFKGQITKLADQIEDLTDKTNKLNATNNFQEANMLGIVVIDGQKFTKAPIRRDGKEAKLKRLKQYVTILEKRGIPASSTNLRLLGFSSILIKAYRDAI